MSKSVKRSSRKRWEILWKRRKKNITQHKMLQEGIEEANLFWLWTLSELKRYQSVLMWNENLDGQIIRKTTFDISQGKSNYQMTGVFLTGVAMLALETEDFSAQWSIHIADRRIINTHYKCSNWDLRPFWNTISKEHQLPILNWLGPWPYLLSLCISVDPETVVKHAN